jgi:hypothetical protein
MQTPIARTPPWTNAPSTSFNAQLSSPEGAKENTGKSAQRTPPGVGSSMFGVQRPTFDVSSLHIFLALFPLRV